MTVTPTPKIIFEIAENRIFKLSATGERLAEVTFPRIGENTVEIDHTFVSEELRGKKAADQLLKAAAAELRRTKRKAKITCSYAQKWFAKHPEYADILIDDQTEAAH